MMREKGEEDLAPLFLPLPLPRSRGRDGREVKGFLVDGTEEQDGSRGNFN